MKKLISLLLVAMMMLSLGAISANAEQPIEITVAVNTLGNGWPDKIEDDWVYQKILADTGVSLKLMLVDDFYTALNARIAGGNVPDMIKTDIDHMRIWARDGVLLDITPYKDKELADYFTWLGATKLESVIVDGGMYGLPQIYDGSKHQYSVTYRQDWMEKLGLQVPTTVQELYDVAYAFTYNDPDGNGQNDTFGLTAAKGMYVFDTIMGSYDTALSNNIIIRDGKVTNTLEQPGMVEGLKWCKKFVEDKVIDPDCVTVSGADKFKAGTVGMIDCSWTGIWKAYGQQQIHDVNPNAVTNFFTTLKSEVGAPDRMLTVDLNSAGTVLGINADITPEKLEAIFKIIDYIISDEGGNMVYYGLEGIHWVRNDEGKITMTDRAQEANYISTYQLFSRKEMEYLEVKFPEAAEVFHDTMTCGRIEIYNSLVIEPEEMFLSDMEAYAKEQLLAFIYGERELTQEEYDKFLQELVDVYEYDVYMEAAAEQLAAYGLV